MHQMSCLFIFIYGFFLSAVSTTKYDTKSVQYSVPKATIKVFHSKGFSVSIADSPGLSLFAFHGNINGKLGPLEGGMLSKDVSQPRNGLWIFTDTSVKLKVGDIINYWLYVEKDGLGYRQDLQLYIVDEFHDDHQSTNHIAENLVMVGSGSNFKQSTVLSGDIHHHHHYYSDSSYSASSSSSQCPSENKSNEFFGKITNQLNVVLMQIQSLHDKTAPLKSKIDSLEEVIGELLKEKDNGTKLLLLGANHPHDSNAYQAIRGVITDGLDLHDLSSSIKFAQVVDGCILFEVKNSIEKHRILLRAQERFNTDKRKIVDFRIDKPNSDIPEIFYRTGLTESGAEDVTQPEIVDRFLFD